MQDQRTRRSINRNKVKRWFITFPHSGEYTPETFLLKIVPLSCIESACGCVETHSDGITPHIHINVHHKYGLTKAQFLNKIRASFPNDYQRIDIRSTRESVESARTGYLSKESINVWYYTNENEAKEKKKLKKLKDYNQNCLKRRHWGSWEFWGLLDIDKTMPLFNYDLSYKENFLAGNVIWIDEPSNPWWIGEDEEM